VIVLDEADKLFEAGKGYLEQVDAVLAACAPCKGVAKCLFSATLPRWVRDVAASVLQEPVSIAVGSAKASSTFVAQRLVFVGQESGKLLALRQILSAGVAPPALIFVATQDRARQLASELRLEHPGTGCVHGGQAPGARDAAVAAFRGGAAWLLVATDLVARGMDFPAVATIISYDFPATTTDYIHRCGADCSALGPLP
jgi:ATP-dependent RNA helicase DDX52/ROK1